MRRLFPALALHISCMAASAQGTTVIVYSDLHLLTEVNQSDQADAYPWLSGDGLRLYYTQDIGDYNIIMGLERATLQDDFGGPVEMIPALAGDQISATLSGDELTIWFASNATVMRATRPSIDQVFGTPDTLSVIGTGSYPKRPSLSPDEQQMLLFTLSGVEILERTGPSEYTLVGPFSSGVTNTGPATMSTDGLKVYFSGDFNGGKVPYRMSRATVTEEFSAVEFMAGDIFPTGVYDWTQAHLSADELVLVGVRGFDNMWANTDLYIATGMSTIGIDAVWSPVPHLGPNPTTGNVGIRTSSEHFERARVYDMNGRCVVNERLTGEPILRLGHLPNGVYTVELVGGTRQLERLVVEH